MKTIIIGLLIPFAGTTAGAACVFALKKELESGVQRVVQTIVTTVTMIKYHYTSRRVVMTADFFAFLWNYAIFLLSSSESGI